MLAINLGAIIIDRGLDRMNERLTPPGKLIWFPVHVTETGEYKMPFPSITSLKTPENERLTSCVPSQRHEITDQLF